MAVSPVDPAPASSSPEGTGEPQDACGRCGAAMAAGQDWCLQCGAGAPGSLGGSGWRALATVLGAVAVLVLGAAAAAYAALSKGSGRAPVVVTTVAKAPTPPASTTPALTTPKAALPTTPGATATTPKAASGLLGLGGSKPPKIPLTAVTPQPTSASGNSAKGAEGTEGVESKKTSTSTSTTTPANTSTQAGQASEESQAAILLDTNAASTYNPYGLPASSFGDPSLAIDGDPSTAWTAQIEPATAPNMAEGLLIDLKSKQKVSVLQLITSTPGMTIQIYGANGQSAPASITDPAWTPLSAARVVKKKHLRVVLRHSKEAFRFVLLWISKAPKSSIGAAQALSHVDVNELELFPTS